MKPVDLNQLSGEVLIEVDVCVIGAGPVGLCMARRLTDRGLDVVLLERGGASAESQSESNETGFDGRTYGGATAGRAYGYGGTSSLWGGQLLPATAHEFAALDGDGTACWPIPFSEVSPYYRTLDAWLRVDPSSFDLAQHRAHPLTRLDWAEFAPRLSKWLAFRQRNVAQAWRRQLNDRANLKCFLNARAIAFERDGRSIRRVLVRGSQARLIVSARHIVIAAGAIESTRLALELFEDPDMRAQRPASLGHFLHDHLSVRLARLIPVNRRTMLKLFAPAFLQGTMRSLRIELAPKVTDAEKMPAAYAHVIAAAPPASGFAVIRDVLRSLQRRHLGAAAQLIPRVIGALPGLVDILFWRAVHRRLAFPRESDLFLQLDFQQLPDVHNRIYLSDELDEQGCRRARIDWKLRDDGRALMTEYETHLSRWWQRNQLGRVAELSFIERSSGDAVDPVNIYDIYHPAGTTRMAQDVTRGCVDTNLRLFGTENLYVASTSVFPVLGAANPTYTAMALGLRLADHIARIAA